MKKRIEIEKKFANARKNLMLVIIFSVVNMALTVLNSNISFLFSATVPVLVLQVGQIFSEESGISMFLMAAAAIALIIIALYGICFLLSKKRRAFMLVALILFVLDTLFLLWTLTLGFDSGVMLDIVFHVWILYFLISGTKAWIDLKKTPVEEELFVEYQTGGTETGAETETDTAALRLPSSKGKVILSHNFGEMEILVKREDGTTELIVNGVVYAEKKGMLEGNYTLNATVGTANIVVEMDYSSMMSLYVNGTLATKKKQTV